MALNIEALVVSPLQQNCYLLSCDQTQECIVVDAGDVGEKIWDYVQSKGLKIKWLVNTHAHVDHVSGVAALKKLSGVPFLMHKNEEMILDMLLPSQGMYGFGDGLVPTIDEYLQEGQEYTFGQETFKVILTPGHTPGGVCLNFGDHIFVGDTLFNGSIGRSDLPGGNSEQLLQSIHSELMCLDPETKVYSGHGDPTTIGFEKQNNPFLV
ncbi:MAG: MBL fold metallo-hydrolase [SAR324 cluster bacterium]|nr:MBL fold metallo-hydrolase [SAR324 cluster bacterium]